VKKTKEKGNRDKAGRFKKGCKGGPGRKPGTIKDLLSTKDGKKISVNILLDDMLGAYAGMGGGKFLAKWATQNHRNLSLFIQLLYKFAPIPTQESTMEFKPLTVQIQKLPEDDAYKLMERDLKQLKDENREMSLEVLRMRSIISSHNLEHTEITHEVVRDKELPSHDEDDDDKPGGGSDRVN
jgi:hypothetical protein